MTIIGISGKRGSGKSMLADNLVTYGFTRLSLADNLKNRCMQDFSLANEQVRGLAKEHPTIYRRTDGSQYTARDIMIRMGCFYRSIDSLFWCKKLADQLCKDEDYVIDDIRFLNEINFFKEMGAKFVRLERSQELNPYKAALDDLSETELDTYGPWDFKLEPFLNNTPRDLKIFAEWIINQLSKSWKA